MAERAFNKRLGRRGAVLGEQRLLKRAAVDADADRDVPRVRRRDDGADAVGVADVARVDAEAVDARLGGGDGETPVEMDVRDERDAWRAEADPAKRLGRGLVGDGEAHDVAAEGHAAADLRDRRLDVARVGVAHRLDGHGGAAADFNAP